MSALKKIQYTDGCAGQYKGKTAFNIIANRQDSITRNFFGSRHGKGPCDSAGGIVKNAVKRAVFARKAIVRDARDFYRFASTKMTVEERIDGECTGSHFRRSFSFLMRPLK